MTEKLEKQIQEVLEKYVTTDALIEITEKLRNVININSSIGQVEEFMIINDQTIRNKPEMPTIEECLFRLELCKEELVEMAEACGSTVLSLFGTNLYNTSESIRHKVEKQRETLKPNLTALLDGLVDQQYVLDGFKLKCGFQHINDDAFEEVHNSNMSKICISKEEAQATVEKYALDGISVQIKEKDNFYLILRTRDNKVLKSINYKPADLYKFISDGLQDIDE